MTKYNNELMWFIDAHNDDNLADAKWWAVLEDAVGFWNEDRGTNYDRTDTVHQWLDWKQNVTDPLEAIQRLKEGK